MHEEKLLCKAIQKMIVHITRFLTVNKKKNRPQNNTNKSFFLTTTKNFNVQYISIVKCSVSKACLHLLQYKKGSIECAYVCVCGILNRTGECLCLYVF